MYFIFIHVSLMLLLYARRNREKLKKTTTVGAEAAKRGKTKKKIKKKFSDAKIVVELEPLEYLRAGDKYACTPQTIKKKPRRRRRNPGSWDT